MVWIKYTKGKEVFLGYMKDRLLRLGTRRWAADFELNKEKHVNEVMQLYKRIIEEEIGVEEAAKLLGAKIIDVRRDVPRFDASDFVEVHYRWDAIKYIRDNKPPLYQRRGEEKVFDSESGRLL